MCVELIYLVFTRTPGGVTVGDSGLCCCVPCLLSAINSLCLLILLKRSRPHSVADHNKFILRSTCKCVYVFVYVLSQFRDIRPMSGLE